MIFRERENSFCGKPKKGEHKTGPERHRHKRGERSRKVEQETTRKKGTVSDQCGTEHLLFTIVRYS